MLKTEAYKCGYCGKIYENKNSCRSHEFRCYFNPGTKSCASCAFLALELAGMKTRGCDIEFQSCKANVDISKKLKTNCQYYLNKKYSDDRDIMNLVENKYDVRAQVERAIDKLEKALTGHKP